MKGVTPWCTCPMENQSQYFMHIPSLCNGYVRPLSDWNSVWRHASGAVVSILVSLFFLLHY
jgi:hypothetical protein